jgi:hypothetical protein
MSSKLFRLFEAMFLLVLSFLMMGCSGNEGDMITQPAQTAATLLPPVDQEAAHPLPLDASLFYYYTDGVRIQLTPSAKWISVKFGSDNPAEQSAALQDSIVDPLGQTRPIPLPELTLLPLRKGLTTEKLLQGIESLRADQSVFLQVNPVFQTADAEMILTDEFIASFPAEKEMQEIDTINLSHGVEIVEPVLGQANTFILRVTETATLDVLSMANLYQESGLAVYAAPNFIRIK